MKGKIEIVEYFFKVRDKILFVLYWDKFKLMFVKFMIENYVFFWDEFIWEDTEFYVIVFFYERNFILFVVNFIWSFIIFKYIFRILRSSEWEVFVKKFKSLLCI